MIHDNGTVTVRLHGLMENRHELLIDACLTLADGMHPARPPWGVSRRDVG